MTKKLPIHITGMENIKGQQAINAILDSINNEIDNHKWVVTTQNYANLKFEKYLESGSTLTVDQKPKASIPVVGTHNNRKVYIGDLDVQGNLIIKDLALRDNVNIVAKTWEYRAEPSSTGTQCIINSSNRDVLGLGVQDSTAMKEVQSIPNDIADPVYGSTIENKITYTAAGQTLDTKTFEKIDTSYYLVYPTFVIRGAYGSVQKQVYSLQYIIDRGYEAYKGIQSGWITKEKALQHWAVGQPYCVYEHNQKLTLRRMVEYKAFSSYDEYLTWIESQTGLKYVYIPNPYEIYSMTGKNSIDEAYPIKKSVQIFTRRYISEEFDKRNSGIVKVDVRFRI